MRINQLVCNNVLSFARSDTDRPAHQVVQFGDPAQLGGSLDILIGPNGSGKSNAMQILDHLFHRSLIKPWSLHRHYIDTETPSLTLSCRSTPPTLAKHRSFSSQPQLIQLELIITTTDRENIQTIRTWREQLATLWTTYTDQHVPDISQWTQPGRDQTAQIVNISINSSQQTRQCAFTGACEQLTHDYIRHFRLFQHSFALLAQLRQGGELPILHETFTHLPARRTYQLVNQRFDQSTSPDSTTQQLVELLQLDLPIFTELKRRIIDLYQTHLTQADSSEDAKQALLTTRRLSQLNEQLSSTIHYQIDLAPSATLQGSCRICFRDQYTGRQLNFSQLSEGEKSIIHFLALLYVYQLRDSIMVIEEPELHIHPYLQMKFLSLLHDTAHTRGMQYIVATHSPFFIKHSTIDHLIRFQKHTSTTHSRSQVYKPHTLSVKQKNLIKALDYQIAGNIFFVEKAIIVEGPDDHYFFEQLIQDRKERSPDPRLVKHYGIFQLNGKHLFPQFQSFLGKFGLETYYIGDRDNISNLLHIDYFELRKELKHLRGRDERTQIKHHYAQLVEYIQSTKPRLYKQIIEQIETLHDQQIYLLRQGSLESYLDIPRKGFDQIIAFCSTRFEDRKHDQQRHDKREELYQILHQIFFPTKNLS